MYFVASGMFAATSCANVLKNELSSTTNNDDEWEVVVLESGKQYMTKVKISGGGRCNVMHDVTKPIPTILSDGYPRGNRELRGIYTKHFTPQHIYEWFTSRGVTLKTEADGRMFPTTDSSQTIIDTITNDAQKNHVTFSSHQKVTSIHHNDDNDDDTKKQFQVTIHSNDDNNIVESFDSIILATGSSKVGYDLASSLGHTVIQPVPSLFTFNAKSQVQDSNGVFHGLAGLSIPHVDISLSYKGT